MKPEMGDEDIEIRGEFSDGAKLYGFVNRCGVPYESIDKDGIEIYSWEYENQTNFKIIRHYCEDNNCDYFETVFYGGDSRIAFHDGCFFRAFCNDDEKTERQIYFSIITLIQNAHQNACTALELCKDTESTLYKNINFCVENIAKARAFLQRETRSFDVKETFAIPSADDFDRNEAETERGMRGM